jgi:hypothetical protein
MKFLHADKELLNKDFLKNLHGATFDYDIEGDDFRVDGGFFAEEEEGKIFGYILYREMSKSKIELVYGGVTREDREFKTLKTYRKFLSILFEKYLIIETLVMNTNYKMLKMYMALGFNIIGTKLLNKNGRILVVLEKQNKVEDN